ncbi:MAG: MMPL family protein, partial [Chrysiogenales bacterium]
ASATDTCVVSRFHHAQKAAECTMIKKALHSRWTAVILTALTVAGLLAIALSTARIDTDVISSLPKNDPVLADAGYIFRHHPIQDQMVIDIGIDGNDPDRLVEIGDLVQERLRESGLFIDVGIGETQALFPDLVRHVQDSLPALLSEDDLEREIRPLLVPGRIREALESLRADLLNLDAIGQAGMISRDPLGFRNIVLAKMAPIAPARDVQLYRGHLLSADGRHLLVVAREKSSGSDTVAARGIDTLIKLIEKEIAGMPRGSSVTLTPVGTYRAALDNEMTARADTQRAIVFATIGIAILLLLVFPRPLIGLLSLVPAIVGTVAAFFIHSLVYESVSILAIGFGGAIISITVDHGMAYLLFLDRTVETRGVQAARDVRSPGLAATLTTVGAFLTLFITGFPILEQIGLFAALGIAFSFIFVHTVFPLIFPVMPPASRERFPALRRAIDLIATRGGLYKPAGVALYALAMLILGIVEFREFHVDLASMNSVTAETLEAEKKVTGIWGNILGKVYLMAESGSIDGLRREGDRLARDLGRDRMDGILAEAFVPSMLFPGPGGAAENFDAWKRFWTRDRIASFKKNLAAESARAGFSSAAFDSLFRMITMNRPSSGPIPERYFGLMGISRSRESGTWRMISTLTPGKKYNGENFYARYTAREGVKMFDPGLFTKRLGGILMSTFLKMLLIIGATITLMVFLFQFEWKLTIVTLLPVAFGLIATFGTLKLLGRPLDLPSIMLSTIIMGMGVDYSLYYVRSYQRFGTNDHEHLGLIRMTIFMAGSTSILGFGVLALAEHTLLRGAGLT